MTNMIFYSYIIELHDLQCDGETNCPFGGCSEEEDNLEQCLDIWESQLDAFDLLLIAHHHIKNCW